MRSYLLNTLFMISCFASAQTPPAIEWQQAFGGTAEDHGSSLRQTNDGGFIATGYTYSSDGMVTGFHGGLTDIWVVKTTSDGSLDWQIALGGTGDESACSVIQTTDFGFIIAGASTSNDGDVSGNHGDYDAWVVKLDQNGSIQWQRTFGGSSSDAAYSIKQTADLGYVVAGETYSTDGNVTNNHGSNDCWVLKLSADGAIEWQHTYGGSGSDFSTSVIDTEDGGYVLAGGTDSNDGDVTGNHGGLYDFWVVKLDGDGQLQWQRTLGGSGFDLSSQIVGTSNGGFAVAGFSDSADGDITNNHGSRDMWVVALDSNGTLEWQKPLGGSGDDGANTIIQTGNGDLVVGGASGSVDGDITVNHGGLSDAWIVRFDTAGSLLWQKSIGGADSDAAYQLVPASDGGYALAGETRSNDGDVSGNHGNFDLWLVKLATDPTGVNEAPAMPSFTLWPNPAGDELNVRFDMVPLEYTRLEVHTSTGQLVRSGSMTGMERLLVLPTADLAPGSYSIRIVTNGTSTRRSFLKW